MDILDMLMGYLNKLEELEDSREKFQAEMRKIDDAIESLHQCIDKYPLTIDEIKSNDEFANRLASRPFDEQLEIMGKITEYKLFKRKKKEEHK